MSGETCSHSTSPILLARMHTFVVPGSVAFINLEFPQSSFLSSWLGAAPGIYQCVFSLFIGELSDIFGRRWFLVVGNVLNLVGSIVNAKAPSVEVLICGQVLTGIGTSLTLLATPFIAEAVPKNDRAFTIGLCNGGTAVMLSVGQVLQGVFQKYHVGGATRGCRTGP